MQIRDVPDDIRQALADRAADRGQSLQSYLLSLVTDEARRSTNLALLKRFDGRSDGSQLTTAQVTEALDGHEPTATQFSAEGERRLVIVIDASVLANAYTDDGPVGDRGRAELGRDPQWAAPGHFVVEVFSAIRSRWLGNKISEQRAVDALTATAATTVDLVATLPLHDRMWQLRRHLTGYDAAYLAVAETFGCPVVTADARLARVPEPRCEVRLALPAR